MNIYAPVLIPTLSRYTHFKRCVESLSACTHAASTELIVALDYPLNESHWDGYRKIERFLDEIVGFKAVKVIKRKENFGANRNHREARQEIFNNYDRYILSEDDNFFSPNFLDYINKGLEIFKDKINVFAICGYNYPIDIPQSYEQSIYIWKGFNAWGCGLWRDKVNKVQFSLDEVNNFLNNPLNIYRLNKFAGHYFPGLLKMLKNEQLIDDKVFCMQLVKDDSVCIFPVLSKVRNYGHDGTGQHCGVDQSDLYKEQSIDSAKYFEFEHYNEEILANEKIYKNLKHHFKQGNSEQFQTYFKFIKYKLGLH